MGKKDAPKPPNPMKTAQAQTAMNQSTAGYEQLLNMVNQVGPDGNLTYSQDGTTSYYDPFTKKTVQVPRYTATQTLSEAQQGIKGETDAAKLNLAGILKGLTGNIQGTLDKPLNLSNEAVEGRLFDLGSARLRPQLERDRASMESSLANRGIRLGSKAYDTATRQQGEKENDLWNQLFLTGRGQAVNELLTERNQPYQEIASLLSGTGISQPNFVNTPQSNVAGTDFAGLTQANYAQQLDAWKTKQDNFASGLGGLFGLGGKIGAAAIEFSDRRLKTDIKKVGKTDDGQKLYSYKYRGDNKLHIGLMAQEVEKKTPEAVLTHPSGFKMVDYSRALHLGAA